MDENGRFTVSVLLIFRQKNYPPHKNHADARLVAAFEQRPGTNRLPIYCCVDRCQGADAQRREVAEPRGFRLPAQLHAQPQENRPPIKTVPMPASPKRSGREESRRRILMVCGDNRRREEDVRRRQEVKRMAIIMCFCRRPICNKSPQCRKRCRRSPRRQNRTALRHGSHPQGVARLPMPGGWRPTPAWGRTEGHHGGWLVRKKTGLSLEPGPYRRTWYRFYGRARKAG